MMEISPVLDRIVSPLVHTTFKGSIVLLAAFGITHWLHSSIQRHFVWSLAFTWLWMLPVAVLLVPSFRPTVPLHTPQLILPDLATSTTATRDAHVNEVNTNPTAIESTQLSLPPPHPTFNLKEWLVFFWVLGVCTWLLYYLMQYVHIAYLFHNAAPITAENWTTDLKATQKTLAVQRPVRLICSKEFDVPVVFGLWHPTIALPLDALTWTAEERRQVLIHELVHIRQGDPLMHTLRQFLCSLHWFNPLVWLAARRSALDAECACDAQVLASGVNAKNYARFLVATAQELIAPRSLDAVHGMARPSELKVRIHALLTTRRHLPVPSGWAAASVLCSVGCVLALAALSPIFAAGQPEVPFRLYYAGGDADRPIDLLVDGKVQLTSIEKHHHRTIVEGPVDIELTSGKHTLTVRYSSSTQILAETSIDLKESRRYIGFVLGEEENTLLRIAEDDLEYPGKGQQKVRVVHAAPRRGDLSVQFRAFDEESREPGAMLYRTPMLRFGEISSYAIFGSDPKFRYDIKSALYKDARGHRGEVFVQDGTITTLVITDRSEGATGFVFWSPDNIRMLSVDPAVREILLEYPMFRDSELVEKLRDDPMLLTKLQSYLISSGN